MIQQHLLHHSSSGQEQRPISQHIFEVNITLLSIPCQLIHKFEDLVCSLSDGVINLHQVQKTLLACQLLSEFAIAKSRSILDIIERRLFDGNIQHMFKTVILTKISN